MERSDLIDVVHVVATGDLEGLPPLHLYRCPECDWWVPCNRHGVIPPAQAQQHLPLELATNRAVAKWRHGLGVNALGRCNRCGHHVDSTNAVCANCNGALP